MERPPLTWIVWPVIYFVLSDARNKAQWATSCGSPITPDGIFETIVSFVLFSNLLVISVSIKPGAMQLTVIFLFATSKASDLDKPINPDFYEQ